MSVEDDTRVPLDAVDLRILSLLTRDARMSRRQIARETGMSTPAITNRIERLEREGVIVGWGVQIDRSKLGYPLLAYIETTSVQGANQLELVAALRLLPEVEAVHPVTGATDLMIRVRVRDIEHLRRCIYDAIQPIGGIVRTDTLISLQEMEPKAFDRELVDRLLESHERPT
ncbi:MAG TPA: Lrp/AsnC family transcriptional regulator [Solirubrobacter sp.]|nr:Lrp/AsnC family transcriptional regulator [Solirubrobacter sp.]